MKFKFNLILAISLFSMGFLNGFSCNNPPSCTEACAQYKSSKRHTKVTKTKKVMEDGKEKVIKEEKIYPNLLYSEGRLDCAKVQSFTETWHKILSTPVTVEQGYTTDTIASGTVTALYANVNAKLRNISDNLNTVTNVKGTVSSVCLPNKYDFNYIDCSKPLNVGCTYCYKPKILAALVQLQADSQYVLRVFARAATLLAAYGVYTGNSDLVCSDGVSIKYGGGTLPDSCTKSLLIAGTTNPIDMLSAYAFYGIVLAPLAVSQGMKAIQNCVDIALCASCQCERYDESLACQQQEMQEKGLKLQEEAQASAQKNARASRRLAEAQEKAAESNAKKQLYISVGGGVAQLTLGALMCVFMWKQTKMHSPVADSLSESGEMGNNIKNAQQAGRNLSNRRIISQESEKFKNDAGISEEEIKAGELTDTRISEIAETLNIPEEEVIKRFNKLKDESEIEDAAEDLNDMDVAAAAA